MKGIEEIESFVDSLPSTHVVPKKIREKRKKPVWRTLVTLGVACCTILVAVMVLAGFLQVFVVLSDSMQPTFTAGDVIVTVDTPARLLRVNDVITYRSPENRDCFVTHRIVNISNNREVLSFQTKGDANEQWDQYDVTFDKIVGRMVVTIPLIGYLASLSHSVLGFLFLVLAPGIVVICGEIYSIVRKEKKSNESY